MLIIVHHLILTIAKIILGDGPSYGIYGSFGSLEKKVDVNFTKAKHNFVWVYIVILIIVIC